MGSPESQEPANRKPHSAHGIIAVILAALVLVASAVFIPLVESNEVQHFLIPPSFFCLLPSFWIAALVLTLKGLKDREHHRFFPTLAAILVLAGMIPGGSTLVTAARFTFGMMFGQ